MADNATPIDKISIEIGASSEEAQKKISSLARSLNNLSKATGKFDNDMINKVRSLVKALNELKDVSRINVSSKLGANIEALTKGLNGVNTKKLSALERLGRALQTFNNVGKNTVSTTLASRIPPLAAAINDLTADGMNNLRLLGDSIRNLEGLGRTSISATLAERLRGIGEAMNGITNEQVTTLERMTHALSQLQGVNLQGFRGAVNTVRRQTQNPAEAAMGGREAAGGDVGTLYGFASNIQNAREMLDALSPGLADLSDKFDQFGARVIRVFDKIEERVKGVKQALNSGKDMNWNLSWSNNLNNIKSYWQNVGGAVSKFFTPGLNVAISLVGKLASGVLNVAKGIAKWAFHTAINALKKIWSLMQRIAQTAMKVGRDIFKGMAKYVTEVGRGVANISRNIARFAWEHSSVNRLKDAFANLKKTLSSFGRVAFYRAVRSAIKYITESFKEGAERAYFYAKEYGKATKYIAEALDQLSSKEFQMQNQLGAAWTSLLATIQPVLIQIINMVSRAAEVLTQFFAVLGGKSTYLKAKDYTHDWAEETEKGAKAAQEWKNQLLGFDEINRLEDSANNSNGNTDKYKDYENMFEEMPIESWVADLSNLFKNIGELNLDDWFKTGIDLAGKLNDLLKKLDDWILKLAPDLKNAARNLAELLNGFIEGFDWELLGKTVGDGINAVFGAIDEFLTNVKWKELGRGLGRAIKTMFDTVDWGLVGKTFADAWNAFMYIVEGIVTTPGIWKSIGTGIGEMVKGWIDNIDIDSMATSVIAIMNGVAEAIENFLAQNPFENLAAKLTNAIERIINEVEWGYIGEQFGKLFQSILDVIHDVIFETDWKAFGTSIGTSIKNFLAEIDAGELGQTLVGVITSALDFVYGMITTPGFTAQLATSLHDFFIGALGQFETWLQGVEPTEVANAIRDFFNNLKADEIKGSFARVVKLAWEKAMELKDELFPKGLLTTITDHLVEYFNSLKWEKLKKTITENAKKMWTAAWATLDAIWPPEKRLEFLHQLASKLLEIIHKAFQWIIDHRQAIHNVIDVIVFGEDKANSMWRKKGEFVGSDLILGTEYGIQSRADALDKAVQGYIVDPVSEAMYKMEQDSKRSSSNTSQGIVNAVKSVSGSMNTMRSSVISNTNGINSSLNRITSTSKTVGTAMQNMQSRSSSSMRNIASSVNSSANSIISGFNRIISKANQAFSATSKIGKVSISYGTGKAYASGGFPEEGPFYMNQGEIAGRFSNGKTVVANNEQITEGIYRAAYRAFSDAFAQTGGTERTINVQPGDVYINGKKLMEVTYQDRKDVDRSHGISLINNFA